MNSEGKKFTRKCGACGGEGHIRTNKLCPLNKKNMTIDHHHKQKTAPVHHSDPEPLDELDIRFARCEDFDDTKLTNPLWIARINRRSQRRKEREAGVMKETETMKSGNETQSEGVKQYSPPQQKLETKGNSGKDAKPMAMKNIWDREIQIRKDSMDKIVEVAPKKTEKLKNKTRLESVKQYSRSQPNLEPNMDLEECLRLLGIAPTSRGGTQYLNHSMTRNVNNVPKEAEKSKLQTDVEKTNKNSQTQQNLEKVKNLENIIEHIYSIRISTEPTRIFEGATDEQSKAFPEIAQAIDPNAKREESFVPKTGIVAPKGFERPDRNSGEDGRLKRKMEVDQCHPKKIKWVHPVDIEKMDRMYTAKSSLNARMQKHKRATENGESRSEVSEGETKVESASKSDENGQIRRTGLETECQQHRCKVLKDNPIMKRTIALSSERYRDYRVCLTRLKRKFGANSKKTKSQLRRERSALAVNVMTQMDTTAISKRRRAKDDFAWKIRKK